MYICIYIYMYIHVYVYVSWNDKNAMLSQLHAWTSEMKAELHWVVEDPAHQRCRCSMLGTRNVSPQSGVVNCSPDSISPRVS